MHGDSLNQDVIAFFTPEVALDQELHTYAGGLGEVSGSLLRAAYKAEFPMVGVSILYKQGYYEQEIHDGQMVIRYQDRTYKDILKDTEIIFPLNLGENKKIWLRIWHLPPGKYNSSAVYFLDANVPQNDWSTRQATSRLYGGDEERYIMMSIILGIGGVEALKRLNIHVRKHHLNDCWGALAAPTVLKEYLVQANGNLARAIELTREKVVFTTHTPVSAGNMKYPLDSIMKLWESSIVTRDILYKIGGDPFDMSACAMKLAGKANFVSKKQLETTKKMWVDVNPGITYVNNGVSQDSWQPPEFKKADSPDSVAAAKLQYKIEIFERDVKEQTGKIFDKKVFTIDWARRLAEYKRPTLLFYDWQWIESRLASGKFQLIIAGKPHPADQPMIKVFNQIWEFSKKLPNVAVLARYELALSKRLKSGADLWLNTPRSPEEASGTSGMNSNGAINMSTPDGWEDQENPKNFFPFGCRLPCENQDVLDAAAMRNAIDEAVNMFYFNRRAWNEKMFAAKLDHEEYWSDERMLRDYIEKIYT